MIERTLVAVYEVDEDGSTGRFLGSGSLVRPELVLVHPELAHDLAGSSGRRLRAGVASPTPGAAFVEVIDVRTAHVAVDPEPEPLVALELSRAAAAPVEPMHSAGAAGVAAARQHLAGLPKGDPPPPLAGAESPDTVNDDPICMLFPHSPGCRGG